MCDISIQYTFTSRERNNNFPENFIYGRIEKEIALFVSSKP